jgi:signal transduction histidine kinase
VTVRVAGTFRDDDLDYAVVSVQDRSREQQVAQLKDAFLARVSHELRTPLTPVLSYAQLLRRHRDALATQEIDEALDQITSQTTHLATLVDDLLLVSRLAAGGLTSEDLVSAEASMPLTWSARPCAKPTPRGRTGRSTRRCRPVP